MALVIIDDILLWANTQEEALKNLCLTLERCREKGIKLNFHDHISKSSEITLNEEKIKAVINITAPQNKKELQIFLGLVNYLRKFSPHL